MFLSIIYASLLSSSHAADGGSILSGEWQSTMQTVSFDISPTNVGCTEEQIQANECDFDEIQSSITSSYKINIQQTEVPEGLFYSLIPFHYNYTDDKDYSRYPMSNVTYAEAALFANILSQVTGKGLCYSIESDKHSDCLNGLQTLKILNNYRYGDVSSTLVKSCKELFSNRDLSVTLAKSDCTGWRLPTENEWEFIAQKIKTISKQTTHYADSHSKNSNNEIDAKTRRVTDGSPDPNGLYNFYGNVWEWTNTPYSVDREEKEYSNLYSVRGGCYLDSEKAMRSTNRYAYPKDQGWSCLGLRLLYSN